MKYVMGLDLGQTKDYTAISVVQFIRPFCSCQGKCNCHHLNPIRHKVYLPPVSCECKWNEESSQLRWLERMPLGTTYPKVVTRVKELLGSSILLGSTNLVVDYTGVGHPVVDLLRDAGMSPYAVNLTGGNRVVRESNAAGTYYNVPKRDLIASLQVMFQNKALKISDQLDLAKTLVKELLAFRVKINAKTAHDTYGNLHREAENDDLVLSVGLCTWFLKTFSGDGIFVMEPNYEERPVHVIPLDEEDVVHQEALEENAYLDATIDDLSDALDD